jgi:Arc/MetJ family transcription regulator
VARLPNRVAVLPRRHPEGGEVEPMSQEIKEPRGKKITDFLGLAAKEDVDDVVKILQVLCEQNKQGVASEVVEEVVDAVSVDVKRNIVTEAVRDIPQDQQREIVEEAVRAVPDKAKPGIAKAALHALPEDAIEARKEIAIGMVSDLSPQAREDTVSRLKNLSPEEIKDVTAEAVRSLPSREQKEFVGRLLPRQCVTDHVWQLTVWAFAIVFVLSALALFAAAFWSPSEIQTLLTVVTTVGGVLAGFVTGRASSTGS